MRFPGSAQDSVMKSGDTSISVCVCGCARVCTHIAMQTCMQVWHAHMHCSSKPLGSWLKLMGMSGSHMETPEFSFSRNKTDHHPTKIVPF